MATRLGCIYAIVNLTNGHRYVGSTAHLQQRKSRHLTELRRNKHGNPHLQAAWNKYGEECFEFVILEYVCVELLRDIEQKYLNERPEYNIATVAWAPTLGQPLPAETRAKIGAALRGRKQSKEAIANFSAARMGHVVSEETRAKISASKKGKPPKNAHIRSQKQKEWAFKRGTSSKGSRHSEETKDKMSAARIGHLVTTETRAKLSAAHTGRRMSDESKAKNAAAHTGIHVSEETRAKLSAAMTRVWANRLKNKEVA